MRQQCHPFTVLSLMMKNKNILYIILCLKCATDGALNEKLRHINIIYATSESNDARLFQFASHVVIILYFRDTWMPKHKRRIILTPEIFAI